MKKAGHEGFIVDEEITPRHLCVVDLNAKIPLSNQLTMPKTVELPLPIRVDKLTEILRIRGVPVYVHWSVLLIVALILFNVIHQPVGSLLALAAYLGVLLIHETGHLIAAQRMRCEVLSIRLYPIFGITKFETPWSKFDHCVVAWGGVIAQAVVAIPIVIFVSLFGYTRFNPRQCGIGALRILQPRCRGFQPSSDPPA